MVFNDGTYGMDNLLSEESIGVKKTGIIHGSRDQLLFVHAKQLRFSTD